MDFLQPTNERKKGRNPTGSHFTHKSTLKLYILSSINTTKENIDNHTEILSMHVEKFIHFRHESKSNKY